MPRKSSVGVSDNTPKKQVQFRTILRKHMNIVRGIMHKYEWATQNYLYFDLNAGSGRYEIEGQTIFGSPLQALSVAAKDKIPCHMLFYEQNPFDVQSLRRELIEFGLHRSPDHAEHFYLPPTLTATLCPGDHNILARDFLLTLLPDAHKHQYGLVYSDENGAGIPFPLLAEFAQQLHAVDILIHLGTTIPKLLRVSRSHTYSARLDELIDSVPKEHWIIREGMGQFGWTFLLGSNWERFPQFRGLGFWPLESPEGRSILRRSTLTTRERQAHRQGNLFPEDVL